MTDSPRDDLGSLPEGIEALRALVLRDNCRSRRNTLSSAMRRSPSGTSRWCTECTGCVTCCCSSRRMHFGPRSERLPEEQLQLGLEALEQAIAKENAEAEKRDPELGRDNAARRRASRGALPAHLPRIEVTLAPEDTACPCCRATMTVIGEGHIGAS